MTPILNRLGAYQLSKGECMSDTSAPIRLLHYVDIGGVGGVEQQFACFVERTSATRRFVNSVVGCCKSIHPFTRKSIRAACDTVHYENRVAGLRIPRSPIGLRRAHERHILSRARPDIGLLWNRMGPSLRALQVVGADKCIYWDHGSSWFSGKETARRKLLTQVPAVIANSHASLRIMQLRWGYSGDIAVCRNALQPNRRPCVATIRSLPSDRPVRIGVVARMVPVKGVNIALHVLAELAAAGHDVVMDIAGDGPELHRLKTLADKLGVADIAIFRGSVRDMDAFYSSVDCLLHTAFREPFGLVLVEAMAHGLPVFCTAIDGMPEVVIDGVTGALLPPSLDIERNLELGGPYDQALPPVVYDPARDCIMPPKLADPSAAAKIVGRVLNNPALFERMSHAAVAHVAAHFDYDRYMGQVEKALQRFHQSGRLSA